MCFIARRKHRERAMRRARLMLRVSQWRRRTQELCTWNVAVSHGDRALLLRVLVDWRASVVEEIADASELAERGEEFFENALMKTHLRAWIRFAAPLRTRTVFAERKAEQWWREKTRENLFRRWKKKLRQRTTLRTRMVGVLLFILPAEFRNSSRQRPGVESAITFHRRRALRKAWGAFVGLNVELADLRRRFEVNLMCGIDRYTSDQALTRVA